MELQEVPADTYANERSREDQAIMQRDSIACLVPYTPALGLSGHYSPKEEKQGS